MTGTCDIFQLEAPPIRRNTVALSHNNPTDSDTDTQSMVPTTALALALALALRLFNVGMLGRLVVLGLHLACKTSDCCPTIVVVNNYDEVAENANCD